MAFIFKPGEVVFTYEHDAETDAGIALVMGNDGKAAKRDVTIPDWRSEFRGSQTFSYVAGELIFNEPGNANPIFISACGTRITSWELASKEDQALFVGRNGSTLHGYGDSLRTNYSDWAVKDKTVSKPSAKTDTDTDLKRQLITKHVLPKWQSKLNDLLDQDGVAPSQETCKPFILETYRVRLVTFLEEAKASLPEDLYESTILKRARPKLNIIDEELNENTWLVRVSAKPDSSRAQPSPAHLQGTSPERSHRGQPRGSDESQNHNPVQSR